MRKMVNGVGLDLIMIVAELYDLGLYFLGSLLTFYFGFFLHIILKGSMAEQLTNQF